VIEAHALLAALSDDYERAAPLAGFSDALYRTHGETRQYTERLGFERLMKRLSDVYSSDEITIRMETGSRLSEKEALALAAAIH
jgi:hypothetical protein